LGNEVSFVFSRLGLVSLTSIEPEVFERCLLDTVDETLCLVLSERTKEAIYVYVEKYCDLRRQEIPRKPDLFVTCLEKIFGRAASVIEKTILKKFYSKLGMGFEEKKDWNFKDYVISAERSAAALSRGSVFEVS